MQSAVTAVSQLLNTTPSQLISQLGTGQSLADAAAAQGVSASTLLATVTKAVAGSVPQGSRPLSGDVLQTVASRIAAATSVPPGFSVGRAN